MREVLNASSHKWEAYQSHRFVLVVRKTAELMKFGKPQFTNERMRIQLPG